MGAAPIKWVNVIATLVPVHFVKRTTSLQSQMLGVSWTLHLVKANVQEKKIPSDRWHYS